MKILHLDEARVWGGAENQLAILHGGLLERDVASVVMCRPGCPLDARVPRGSTMNFRPRFELDMAAAMGLVHAVRREEPDVVHAHTSRSHAIARLAQLVDPEIRLVVSRRVNYPIRRNGFSRLKYRFGVARYIAVCEAVRQTLVRGGVAAERVIVVYSCARNVGSVPVRKARGAPFVVGFAGRLERNKRPLDALEAVARLRGDGIPAVLQVAGDGSMKDEMHRAAGERGLGEGLALLGHRADLSAFFGEIDALAFCSEGGEGLPNVILEAMAAAVPVVASRVDGVPEVLRDEETGRLYPPGDVEALTFALRSLYRDSGLRAGLAENGLRIARETLAPERMVALTLQVYEEVVAAARRDRRVGISPESRRK